MGQPDLAVRFLADLLQAQLVPALLAPEPVQVLQTEQTELKIIERQTDKVVHALVGGVETIVHVEFQASHDPQMPVRVLAYHAMLGERYRDKAVRSIVVYLMHEPPASGVPCGVHRRPGDDQLEFSYDVYCAWERPITLEDVRRTPTLAPLAPLTPGLGAEDLPALQALLEREVRPLSLSGDLQALTVILASRRYPLNLLQSFLGSEVMLESTPGLEYFLSLGEARGEARGRSWGIRAIIRLVEHRLGAAPAGLDQRLSGLELDTLQELFDRVVEAEAPEVLRRVVDEI